MKRTQRQCQCLKRDEELCEANEMDRMKILSKRDGSIEWRKETEHTEIEPKHTQNSKMPLNF